MSKIVTGSPWHCQTLGNPAHTPLILLHGFMGRGTDFLPISKRLARHFFCILPDLPGHGDTPLPTGRLSFARLAAEFQTLLAAFDIQTFTLGGYSMGGRLALYFAVQYAHRVQHLVLESASPGIQHSEARTKRLATDHQRAEHIRQIGMQAFLQEWYAMPLFASLQRFPQTLQAIIAERSRLAPSVAARVIEELSPGQQPPLWDALPSLPMPVLLLGGALDKKYAALLPRMAWRIPRAQTLIVAQAGHNVHLERPGAWQRAVLRFLNAN